MSWGEHGYVEEDDDNLYFWSAKRLWQLAATEPVILISLDDFDWTNDNFQFNLPTDTLYWRDIGDQAKQILAADLSYPIIISANGNVMDGMHRILKAYVFNLPSIPAVRFAVTPSPDRVVPLDQA